MDRNSGLELNYEFWLRICLRQTRRAPVTLQVNNWREKGAPLSYNFADRLESVSQFHKTIAQIRTENPDAGLFRLNFHFDEAICAMETAQKVSV